MECYELFLITVNIDPTLLPCKREIILHCNLQVEYHATAFCQDYDTGILAFKSIRKYLHPKDLVRTEFLCQIAIVRIFFQGIFMYVDNLLYFGRLLDTSIFNTTRKHGDMYEMMNNVLVRLNLQNKDPDMVTD